MTVLDVCRSPRGGRAVDGDEWVVEALCRPGARAEVRRVGSQVHLRVHDGAADLASWTDVWLHMDGRVEVRCSSAPPALLVAADGSRLVPSLSEGRGGGALRAGDLLVVCSAGALDHLPFGIGAVLAWDPRQLAVGEPAALLERLMTDSDEGAALLVRYRGPAVPAQPEPAHHYR